MGIISNVIIKFFCFISTVIISIILPSCVNMIVKNINNGNITIILYSGICKNMLSIGMAHNRILSYNIQ